VSGLGGLATGLPVGIDVLLAAVGLAGVWLREPQTGGHDWLLAVLVLGVWCSALPVKVQIKSKLNLNNLSIL
jgi:hypothetical protein